MTMINFKIPGNIMFNFSAKARTVPDLCPAAVPVDFNL